MTATYQFAGITDAQKLGAYYVQDAARLMNRLSYSYYRLMRIGAGQLPARVNWHFKAGVARHLYEDSQARAELADRVAELRAPQAKQQPKAPDPWLEVLFDELLMARSDYELCAGIYEVIRPELKRIVDLYIERTQPLVDYPTVRVLKRVRLDLEEQISWGQSIAPVLQEDAAYFRSRPETGIAADDADSAAPFVAHLRGLLAKIGGLDGAAMADVGDVPDRRRSTAAFEVVKKAVRDPRMGGETLGRTGVANPPEDSVLAPVVKNARTRQEELGAAELCAATLYLQDNMPWSFYADMARHCWDEMRHTLFGQAVLDSAGYDWFSMPQFKGDYDPHMKKPVASAYVWLSVGIEGSAMKKDAMPKESRDLRALADKTGDPFVTFFAQCVDYDWADEVTHHQYGRKWAEDLIGDYHTSEMIAHHEMKLNLIRMAEDTYTYWADKPDSHNKQLHLREWASYHTPEMLAFLAANG
ncbi:MAG: hypothetical protein J7639_14695 [Paenibacillaceae bacterium]|nr:hypothetical protein [Paenibacillaceae bacterium]